VPLAAPSAELNEFSLRRASRAEVLNVSSPDSHFGLIARLKDDQARRDAFARYGRPALMSRLTVAVHAALGDWCGTERYQLVHVSRLYLAELAAPWTASRERGTRCVLDCDEDDAAAFLRIARMHEQEGESDAAAWARLEASAFARVAAQWLPRFDYVLAAAAGESRSLSVRAGNIPIATVPNTIAIKPLPQRPPRKRCRTILFVGNLSYAPNAEAIRWFARHAWPRLRRRMKAPLRLLIVGASPPASVARLDGRRGIRVTGAVDDVAPYYAAADLVIVPVRSGGGTRIKLIEAAERGVPLVATTFGAAGTSLRNGRELLVADDASAFARACAALIADPRRADAIASRARRRVRTDYDARIWQARLTEAMQGHLPADGGCLN